MRFLMISGVLWVSGLKQKTDDQIRHYVLFSVSEISILIYRPLQFEVTLLIFASGKVVIVGLRIENTLMQQLSIFRKKYQQLTPPDGIGKS